MEDASSTESVVGSTPAADEDEPREYLLCIAGDRSFRIDIPASGELVIGRGTEAGWTLDDPLVSRAHLQLMAVPDGLRVEDLGSRHGTSVNGEHLLEPRLVGSGDVIAIGGTLFVVRRPARPSRARNVLEKPALFRRLAEELSRAARYERELALLIVRSVGCEDPTALLVAITDRLRVIDTTAAVGTRHVAILLPELGADQAARMARGIAGGGIAAGVAVAPFDGIDPDTLLSAARAACDKAGAGEVLRAGDAFETVVAGDHCISIADPGMAKLYDLMRRLARSTIPILILGETGAGKELAAASIHAFSARATGPFVSVNCAAIPEGLAESELFGHARGAFSGAVATKLGQLELASGGTLFLDEIGELSLSLQVKLLRALESGELTRVGEVKSRKVDLRIVAATNRDLEAEVSAERFRSDLYFRLGAARLELPPLRERPRDIALLSTTHLEGACRRLGRPPLRLSIGVALALFRYAWPGNVRELKHVIDYVATAAPDAATEVEVWHLPANLATLARSARDAEDDVDNDDDDAPVAQASWKSDATFRPIADEVRDLERMRMIAALRASGGIRNRAAELIEMPLRTFLTKLKRYAISPSEWTEL